MRLHFAGLRNNMALNVHSTNAYMCVYVCVCVCVCVYVYVYVFEQNMLCRKFWICIRV
jgi:hypothetical protein